MRKRTIFILGALAGAAAALLLTPKSGTEMKHDLLKKIEEMQRKVKNFELDDVKCILGEKLNEIRDSINRIDWESPKVEFEAKFNEIKGKLKEISAHLSDAKDSIREEAGILGENLEDDFDLVIDTVKETAKSTAAEVADVIKEDTELVKETVKKSAEHAKKAASDIKETVKE